MPLLFASAPPASIRSRMPGSGDAGESGGREKSREIL
jgi:hypothetical protein